MKIDRSAKILLTVIAACLGWIALRGLPEATVHGQFEERARRFEMDPCGGANCVFRLDTETGEIELFWDTGSDPRSKVPWEQRVVTGPQAKR